MACGTPKGIPDTWEAAMCATDVPGKHIEQGRRASGVWRLAGDENICSDDKCPVIIPCAALWERHGLAASHQLELQAVRSCTQFSNTKHCSNGASSLQLMIEIGYSSVLCFLAVLI